MKHKIVIVLMFFFATNIFSQENKYLLSKQAYEKANYSEALSYLEKFITKYPKNKKALSLKNEILFKNRNYADAKKNILELNKNQNKDYYLLLARAWAGLNNKNAAIANLKLYMQTRHKKSEEIIKSYVEFDILTKNSEWVNIWKKDMYSRRERLLNNAIYAYSIKNYSEAQIYLNEYLNKYKQTANAYYINAKINFIKGNYKIASVDFKKAINLTSNNHKINLDYAICLINIGKNKKALQILNVIIKNDNTEIESYYHRANIFFIQNKLEDAQNDIEYYLQYYHRKENAIYLSAKIDYKYGNYLTAIPKFSSLIKQKPNNPDYFIARADSYIKTKTYHYAINDYSMALDLNPKMADVYFKKANAHLKLGETKQACVNWNYSYKLGNNQCTKFIYKYCK